MSIGLLRMVVVIHVIFAAMMIILMMIREVITIITDLMKTLKIPVTTTKSSTNTNNDKIGNR